jgi:uncharacterized phage protein (TIGR02220 family)
MRDGFYFSKELAKLLDTPGKITYAIKYGLGRVTRCEDPGYAEIADRIDAENKEPTTVTREEVREIIGYLNERCGAMFRPSAKDTIRHINARFAEGYTVEDFKAVIDSRAAEWKSTEQAQYLRPSTLFGTKFAGYLSYARAQERDGGNDEPESSFETDAFFAAAMERTYGKPMK